MFDHRCSYHTRQETCDGGSRRHLHLHQHLPERGRGPIRLRRDQGPPRPWARIGTYDVAVITKDAKGKTHVNKDELSTRHGAWGGAAAGAVVGLLFPAGWSARRRSAPPSAASVATSGTACRGRTSRSSATSSTPARPHSSSSARARWRTPSRRPSSKAEKRVAKQLDVSTKDIDAAVQEAAKEIG